MQLTDLQPGDILVTLGRSPLSIGIAWWTHADFSHVMPVVDGGQALDMKWPHPEVLDPNTLKFRRVVHLRPTIALNKNQEYVWCTVARGMAKTGKYDLASFIGWLTGTGSNSHRRTNCAEATLRCCKTIGDLGGRTDHLISPQSFIEYAHAGMYRVVKDFTWP